MNTVKEPPNGHGSSSFFKSVISKLKSQHDSGALASEPSDKLKPDRCQFTFSDGRQCRMQRASLCAHHASKPPIRSGSASRANNVSEGSLRSLEPLCGDLTTATNINRALAQVFLLMAQGRISQKQAVAFGYLTQLLLQTVPGIRSEFVSAFGYRQWEAKLKISLAPNSNQDPGPSGGENKQPMSPIVERQKGVSSREVYQQDELRALTKSTPLLPHKEAPAAPPADSGSAHSPQDEPDYDSIYSRSLDLLDRKYDTTPEGRREANALALDLELMKPPDSKPPKGYFGQVVDLVRRLRARQQRKPAVAVNASRPSPAPAAPNAPIVPAPPAATVPNASSPASVPAAASAAPVNLPSPPGSHSKPSPACPIKKPEAPDYVLPALAAKQAAPPPVRRVPPTRPTPAAPRPEADPELPETKASLWDGRWRPPMPIDPLAPRSTAFERKLRGMSNAGWRRWQHRNSRCF